MNFFTDENIPPKLGKLIELFDPTHSVCALSDAFPTGTPDTVWLSELGKRNPKPALLCGDGRILSNKAESAALKTAELTFVLLAKGWTQMPWGDQAWKMLKVWPEIVQNVERAKKPTIFRITPKNLKVEPMRLVSELR